jgi:uncharacterized protein involved in response to NO
LGEPARRLPPNGFALWALGFRPFYLLAAAFAVFGIGAWIFVLAGRLTMPMAGLWWHAHEMLFGFAAAVIVGFLFTAGRNWTGLATPTGPTLAALAALWLAGRLGLAFSGGWLAALCDLLFLPAAAVALARVLWRAGSRRNYFVVGILALLACANLIFHLARLGILALDPLMALHCALGVIILLETIIGGRVIPAFTVSALQGVRQWRNQTWDYAAIAATGMALFVWIIFGDSGWTAALSILAAALQARRALGWNPWATRRVPLLWILHVSPVWIPLGLALLATAELGWLPRSAAIHALTIGATGGLIIGMITRTALGHTGRTLAAGPLETAAYALVQLAALTRVLTVAAIPAAATAGIHIAATAWILAFLLYLWRYLPWLIRPRVDGQAG